MRCTIWGLAILAALLGMRWLPTLLLKMRRQHRYEASSSYPMPPDPVKSGVTQNPGQAVNVSGDSSECTKDSKPRRQERRLRPRTAADLDIYN
jgi:hypothetical protein